MFFAYLQRHSRAFFFTVAVFAAAGVAVLTNMPVSLFPDITFPRIVILADNGEQPSERMMVEVTKPLEEIASSIPGVNLVRSTTSRGSTEISIQLDWGANVQQTLLLLQGRIANARTSLPPTANIQAEQMMVSVFPILGYSLTSDSLSLVELRDIALYQIRPAILGVEGVAKIEVTGGDIREFSVTVAPEKLAAYGLDIRQVSEALDRTNFVSSAGLVSSNFQLYLTLVSGLTKNVDEIGNVVVATRQGTPIFVKDVATVAPSTAYRTIRTTARGRDAVLLNIMKQPTGSTVQIGRDVNARVTRLKLPAAVHFETFYDQGDFIRSSILSTRDSIVIGVFLSMGVLLLFLRSWRTTFVIALVVPTTIAGTIGLLFAVGRSINIMTLGGMAAAVGLIIDDSIVIIEHIFTQFTLQRSRDAGASFATAASHALNGLMPAIIGSTASTIVIHIPLAFLGGVTGAFFASLSITMVIALLLSCLLSITLSPLLAATFLHRGDIEREATREREGSRFTVQYESVMGRLMQYRGILVPLIIIIFVGGAYFFYLNIGSGFMPEMDEGTFVLDYKSPPGTSLDETNRMLMQVEEVLMSTGEIDTYSRRTGTQLGFFLTEPNDGDYLVRLKSRRDRSIEEVMADVRTRVQRTEPALQLEFGQLMMDVIGDLTNNPSPVEIKLFGDDRKQLELTAQKISELITTVPGVVDVFDGILISGPALSVIVDPTRCALAGMQPSDVRDQLGTMVSGTAETQVQYGEKLIAIRVRYPRSLQEDIYSLENLSLANAAGVMVPLRNVARIERLVGQTEIHRERLRQFIAVTARISGRDLGRTIAEIQGDIRRTVRLPSGVSMEFGGVYQTQQESFRGLLFVSLAAFLLVCIVLLFEFESFAIPLSVLVVDALALFGVFGALWLTGTAFNISSFVGIIMIIGIVAENAVFVLHTAQLLHKNGLDLDTAMIRATRLRARPIMMTTLAAVLALLPLSLGIGAGAQMQQPLAIAVIGGFSLSSIMLFFALPLIVRFLMFRKTW